MARIDELPEVVSWCLGKEAQQQSNDFRSVGYDEKLELYTDGRTRCCAADAIVEKY